MASDFKFSHFAITKFLNVLRGTNITAPATIYIGLLTGSVLQSNSLATVISKEVSDTGYARQAIEFNTPALDSGIMKIINTNNEVFGAFNTGGFTASHFFITDVASGSSGNFWGAGALDSNHTLNAGNTISLNAGNGKIGIN